MRVPEEYRQLLALLGEIDDLRRALAILDWDEKTHMPQSGAEARAQHKATIERLIHQRRSSLELGRLLDKLRAFEHEVSPDSDESGILRIARRDWQEATALPASLVSSFSAARSRAFRQWLQAREAKDYRIFSPAAKEILAHSRQIGELLGDGSDPREALLRRTEPGMSLAAVEEMFSRLRQFLVPLARRIFEQSEAIDDRVRFQHYPVEGQWRVGLEGVRAIGFKIDEGRADTTVHAFATSFGPGDTRINTRMRTHDFVPCFFGLLHEAGHGHYMQGIPDKYQRTPLYDGASSGMHESQSRLWQVLVGRSWPFWRRFFPRVQQEFPDQVKGLSAEDWYRSFNRVNPSLIRVEADEVTYNLHIMIRWEVQKELYSGTLAIEDLAEAWNAKHRDYLGIEPDNDTVGILQDIHFTGGIGASFVSYTLGNMINAQLYEAALQEVPGLAEAIEEQADYSGLLSWTQAKIHAHGAKFEPADLVERATGQKMSTEAFERHILAKFGQLYDLAN